MWELLLRRFAFLLLALALILLVLIRMPSPPHPILLSNPGGDLLTTLAEVPFCPFFSPTSTKTTFQQKYFKVAMLPPPVQPDPSCKPPPSSRLIHYIQALRVTPYLIFVTNFTNEICGEKFVVWRNFNFNCMTDVEKSEISPHVE